MKGHEKTFVGNYEKNKTYMRRGKKIRLADIIASNVDHHGLTEDSLPTYKNEVHPWLYYNYLIDWESVSMCHIPEAFKTSREFGLSLIKEWHKVCWKNNYAATSPLNIYDNIDELEKATDEILGGNYFRKDKTYKQVEEALWEWKQSRIQAEEEKRKAEIDRLEEEKEIAQMEGQIKELQRKKEELRRKKKEDEAARVKLQNKMMASKENGPWTADISKINSTNKKDDMAYTNKKATTKMADVFESSNISLNAEDPFAEIGSEILKAPVPAPTGTQIQALKSRTSGNYIWAYGEAFMKDLVGHSMMLRKIGGEDYITFDNQRGSDKSMPQNPALAKAVIDFYGAEDYVMFDVSENVSKNPALKAFKVKDINCD